MIVKFIAITFAMQLPHETQLSYYENSVKAIFLRSNNEDVNVLRSDSNVGDFDALLIVNK